MKRHKVFISHKNEDTSNKTSSAIQKALVANGHEVFLDMASLEGGNDWKEDILTFLVTSDLLILIITEATADSDWVQREVDTARACNISILPVVFQGGYEKAKAAFERFALGNIQLVKFDVFELEKSVQEILDRVAELSNDTVRRQKRLIDDWQKRHKGETDSTLDPNAVSFIHPDMGDKLTFHIATGDATRIRGYDILVNTENNYMQMARFFETNTLSWSIRTRGALLENERLIEDTVQDSLYQQILYTKSQGSLPVSDRTVIVTSAGHPESLLCMQTNFRYIFHAASVRVELVDRRVSPVGNVNRIIENCFRQVGRLEKTKGQLLLDKDGKLIADEEYKSPESILFPVFGAGDGGGELADAVDEVVRSIRDLSKIEIETYNLAINKIGLSLYNRANLEIVIPIFEKYGFVKQEARV